MIVRTIGAACRNVVRYFLFRRVYAAFANACCCGSFGAQPKPHTTTNAKGKSVAYTSVFLTLLLGRKEGIERVKRIKSIRKYRKNEISETYHIIGRNNSIVVLSTPQDKRKSGTI